MKRLSRNVGKTFKWTDVYFGMRHSTHKMATLCLYARVTDVTKCRGWNTTLDDQYFVTLTDEHNSQYSRRAASHVNIEVLASGPLIKIDFSEFFRNFVDSSA